MNRTWLMCLLPVADTYKELYTRRRESGTYMRRVRGMSRTFDSCSSALGRFSDLHNASRVCKKTFLTLKAHILHHKLNFCKSEQWVLLRFRACATDLENTHFGPSFSSSSKVTVCFFGHINSHSRWMANENVYCKCQGIPDTINKRTRTRKHDSQEHSSTT